MRFASFGEKWTSSIFMSQDPVAIDSVALDFVRNESKATDCTGRGVDNYLHEAALANDPPSGRFYDPDGDGVRLESLGVHEHWNNATDKKYSRNLGTGNGIELVIPTLTSDNGPVHNLSKDTRYDLISHAVQDANEGDVIAAAPGTYDETVDFRGKNLLVRSEDPNDPSVVTGTVIRGGAQAVVFSGGEDANCVLAGLTVTSAGQGIYCNAAMPTIVNCRIVDNALAGVKLWEGSYPTIANCIIEGNGGVGIDLTASTVGRFVKLNQATIFHCTIVGNREEGVKAGKPIIVNSIIYMNGAGGQVPQISARDAAVSYCDVEGGYAGTGNIDADPCFASPPYWGNPAEPNLPAARDDPTAVWVSGDYHLRDNSPCIDAGDPDFFPAQTPNLSHFFAVDIDGQPRVMGPRPDLGYDEVARPEPEPVPGP